MSAPVRTRRTAIVGDRSEVEAALRTVDLRGELVRVDSVEMLAGNRAKVIATVADTALAQRQQLPARRVRRSRVKVALVTTGVTLVVGTIGVAVWAVIQAVQWVAQHWATVGGIALLALLLLFVVLPRAGVCPGIHCPGCKH